LLCLTLIGCIHNNAPSDKLDILEEDLKNVEGSDFDEDHVSGEFAYVELIQADSSGHRILSDAWVRGNIWLASWVQW